MRGIPADFAHFDWVSAMDHDNLRNIRRLADSLGSESHIHLMRDFDTMGDGDEVPDPYYGGAGGFEAVYEMVYRSCKELLDRLRVAQAPRTL